jgi:hypothetical protein
MRACRLIVVLRRSRSMLDKVSRIPPPQDLGRKADVEPLAVRHRGGVQPSDGIWRRHERHVGRRSPQDAADSVDCTGRLVIGHVLAQAGLPPGGDVDGGEAEHRQTQQALIPAWPPSPARASGTAPNASSNSACKGSGSASPASSSTSQAPARKPATTSRPASNPLRHRVSRHQALAATSSPWIASGSTPAKRRHWPRTSNSRHRAPLAAPEDVPGQLGRMAETGRPRDPVAVSPSRRARPSPGSPAPALPRPGCGLATTTIFPNGHGLP